MLESHLANGLALGGAYALIAVGYALIFGVLRVVNLAHGEIFLAGALIGYEVSQITDSFILIVGLAILGAAAVGVLIERVVLRRLRGEELAVLTATIAIALLIQSASAKLTDNHPVPYPPLISDTSVELGSFAVSLPSLVMIIVSIVITLALTTGLRRSSLGRQIRATASDEEVASMLGVRVGVVRTGTMAVASGLGALAGVLVAVSLGSLSTGMGEAYGLKGLVILIVGGMGSVTGAAVIGFGLGILETLVVAYGPGDYRDAITFGVLIAVLLLRPQGLFGRAAIDRA